MHTNWTVYQYDAENASLCHMRCIVIYGNFISRNNSYVSHGTENLSICFLIHLQNGGILVFVFLFYLRFIKFRNVSGSFTLTNILQTVAIRCMCENLSQPGSTDACHWHKLHILSKGQHVKRCVSDRSIPEFRLMKEQIRIIIPLFLWWDTIFPNGLQTVEGYS